MDDVQRFWGAWQKARAGKQSVRLAVDGEEYEISPEQVASGTYKHIFDLGDGRVLMLPNRQRRNIYDGELYEDQYLSKDTYDEWRAIIARDCEGSAIARAHGLLSQDLRPVRVELGGGAIEAMVAPHLREFQTQGIEVRDMHHTQSHFGQTRRFRDVAESVSRDSYRKIYRELMPDIVRLFESGLPFGADTINLALEHAKVNAPQTEYDGEEPKFRLMLYDFPPEKKAPIHRVGGMTPEELRNYVREEFSSTLCVWIHTALYKITEQEAHLLAEEFGKNPDALAKAANHARTNRFMKEMADEVTETVAAAVEALPPALRKRRYLEDSQEQRSVGGR